MVYKRLSKEQWGEHANIDAVDGIINEIKQDTVSCWSKEMLRLTKPSDMCLEIGCGTGQTVGYLAANGRNTAAVDYSDKSIEMTNELLKRLGISNSILICQDAINEELPFKDGQFDVVYSCGLLEHFEREERIKMLSKWRRFSNTMISMIPNASSIAYHYGKNKLEDAGKWKYGMELPQNTIKDEYTEAGYVNIEEHTIGSKHALGFLPKFDPLRIQLEKLIRKGVDLEKYHQGYLLVTIGYANK